MCLSEQSRMLIFHTKEQTDDDCLVRKTINSGDQMYWEDAYERITIGSEFYEKGFPCSLNLAR